MPSNVPPRSSPANLPLGSKRKTRNSLACLRNAGSYSAVKYCMHPCECLSTFLLVTGAIGADSDRSPFQPRTGRPGASERERVSFIEGTCRGHLQHQARERQLGHAIHYHDDHLGLGCRWQMAPGTAGECRLTELRTVALVDEPRVAWRCAHGHGRCAPAREGIQDGLAAGTELA